MTWSGSSGINWMWKKEVKEEKNCKSSSVMTRAITLLNVVSMEFVLIVISSSFE